RSIPAAEWRQRVSIGIHSSYSSPFANPAGTRSGKPADRSRMHLSLTEVALMQTAYVRAVVLVACLAAAPYALADGPPRAEHYLVEGRLAEGETALVAALQANPKDSQ